MPYASNDELPDRVRLHLPSMRRISIARRSTTLGRNTVPQGREDIAHRIAWSAVKRQYRKQGSEWMPLEL